MIQGIDAHIHLDMYEEEDARNIISELDQFGILALVAVSKHLLSCEATKRLRSYSPNRVFAAYGYHPEQEAPNDMQRNDLVNWIAEHAAETVAIGEIGLPYYLRQEAKRKGLAFDDAPYIGLLECMLELAARLQKPVVLHAVYEDAALACDLLEKHGIRNAHFHWFKGSEAIVQRLIHAGFYISITPDVVYKEKIQALVRNYPIERIMVETDGPWPFEGPFAGRSTHPSMIHTVIEHIALLKTMTVQETAKQILRNTQQFYQIELNV